MKKKLYVLRHCKTLFNEKNIVSGQTDCPLLEYSVNYSILSKESQLESYILISSPLNRCVLTGKILQTQSGLQISSSTDSRIIERNMGILEGKKRCELFKEYMTPPMGESFDEFKFRITSFSHSIEKMLLKNNIIICSHNQALRMLTAIIKDKQFEDIPKYPNGLVQKLL